MVYNEHLVSKVILCTKNINLLYKWALVGGLGIKWSQLEKRKYYYIYEITKKKKKNVIVISYSSICVLQAATILYLARLLMPIHIVNWYIGI